MYLNVLLDGYTHLHLALEFELDLLRLGLVLLLVLVEILYVLLQDLVAVLQRVVSILGLFLQIRDLLVDDFVSHSYQEHFFLLLQYVNDGFVFPGQVLVLFPHLDDLQCVLDQLLVLGVERVLWNKVSILGNNILVKPLEGSAAGGSLLVPYFLVRMRLFRHLLLE
jgi:hypothetical protein